MIDTQTSNKSFIHIWRMFQDLNIDNNSFMLELKDESLQGFNMNDLDKLPEDKRNEMMRKVIAECKNNIWFFFREVIKIGNPVSNDLHFHENDSRFILTAYSALMIYLYTKKKSCIIASSPQYKRYGLTTTTHLLSMYDYHILEKVENMKLLEFTDTDIENNLYNLYLSNNRIFPIMDYTVLKIRDNSKRIDENLATSFPDEYVDKSNIYGICKNRYPYVIYRLIKKIVENPSAHLYMRLSVENTTDTFNTVILPSLGKVRELTDGNQFASMLMDYTYDFHDNYIMEFSFTNDTLKEILDDINKKVSSTDKIIFII